MLPVSQSSLLPPPLGASTGSQQSKGKCGFGTGVAQTSRGDPWVRFCLWLKGRLPDGVQHAISRNYVPLTPSENLKCHSPDLLPCQLNSVDAVTDSNESLWQDPAQLRKLGIYSPAVPFSCGRNHGTTSWAVLFRPKLCCLRGEVMPGK